MALQTQVVPKLGDCLHNVAVEVHQDLVYLLKDMSRQESDLRTTAMRDFVQRTRKLLYQILALCTWLRQENVLQIFNAVQQFHMESSLLSNLVGRNMDEVYFLHAGLYNLISPKYQVSLALDIVTNCTYRSLPSSIFTFGNRTFPVLQPPAEVQQRLDLCIRAKLALHDKPPPSYKVKMCLKDGTLKLQCEHYFLLFLSLKELTATSNWKVLGFKIIHDAQYTKHTYYMREIELKAAELIQQRRSSSLRLLLSYALHLSTKERLKQVQRHIAGMASLPLYKQHLVVNSFDNVDGYDLRIYFWGNDANQHMRFMLRLFTPTIKGSHHELEVALYGYKELAANEFLQGRIETHYKQIRRFSEEDVRFLLDYSTTPEMFMNHIWVSILETKMSLLATRMKTASSQQVLSMEVQSSKTIISIQDAIKLEVSVDSRSGKYAIDLVDCAHLYGYCEDIIERFKDEINSVDSERLLVDYLLATEQQTMKLPAIVTLGLLLTRIDLAVFALKAVSHLPLATDDEMLEVSRQYYNVPNLKLDMIAFVLNDWDGMHRYKLNTANFFQSLQHQMNQQLCKSEPVVDVLENQHDKKRIKRVHNDVALRPKKHWVLVLMVSSNADYSKVLHYGLLKYLPSGEKQMELVLSVYPSMRVPALTIPNISEYLSQAKAWADNTIAEKMTARSFTQIATNNIPNLASYPSLSQRYAIFKCACEKEDDGGELIYLSFEEHWLDVHFYTCAENYLKERFHVLVKDSSAPKCLQEYASEKGMSKPSRYASLRLKLFRSNKKDEDSDSDTNIFALDKFELFHKDQQSLDPVSYAMFIQDIQSILGECPFSSTETLSSLVKIFECTRALITMLWINCVFASNTKQIEEEEDFEAKGLSLRPVVTKRQTVTKAEHEIQTTLFAMEQHSEDSNHKDLTTYIASSLHLPSFFEDSKPSTFTFEPYFDQLSNLKLEFPISAVSFGQAFHFLDALSKFNKMCKVKL